MTRSRLLQQFWRCTCSLAVVLSVVGMTSLALAAPRPAADWEDIETALREALSEAAQLELPLHGAWPAVEAMQNAAGETTGMRISLIADTDPTVSARQKEAAARVASRFLAPSEYVVDVTTRLPIHRLLTDLESQIEFDPKMAGAAVEDGFLSEADGQLFLNLIGRVANDEQRAAITNIGQDLVATLFRNAPQQVNVRAEPVTVVIRQPSSYVSSRCFNQALECYTHCRFDAAYRLFTRSSLEAPTRRDIQFWRVAALIGAKRDLDAERLLTKIVNPAAPGPDVAVLNSLERVQGPIRWKMQSMVNQILCGSPDCR
ncbi:MAG TPA: hypothetical protein VHB77_05910 [Planctomycetaceae bacterium]|nr:hypothetical protein [Planctomycetaceae bacterium]